MLSAAVGTALIFAVVACALSAPAGSQVRKVPNGPAAQYQFHLLHSFAYGSPTDGSAPTGLQVFDQKGNLYGATIGGGAYAYGTVYELTPGTDGQWTETILHNFPDGATDGYQPTGVVIDGAGNLYGGTTHSGLNDRGTVFELTPGANGQWTETILWNFCAPPGCAEGGEPEDAPTLNPAGDLYGVTGGYPGTAFELTPGSGGWTFTLLYTFCSLPNCSDGAFPVGGATLDAKGNLYGETLEGGTSDGGTVFVLQSQPGGQWKEAVLHDFDVHDPREGYDPSGGVTLHQNGLYATTQVGGVAGCSQAGCGTVFELTRGSGGVIDEEVLHAFSANGSQGILPDGVVVFDKRGDLFGVAQEGGSPSCGCGTVYGMKPEGNGNWAFGVLHTFTGLDGVDPVNGLTVDSKGNLYGTTYGGGSGEGGVAYELSPVTQASN